MNGNALRTRDEIAAKYLQQLQALAVEISSAMDAIACNALPKFQECVAKQEILCDTLASMAKTVGEGFQPPTRPSQDSADSAMSQKIWAASLSIRNLNLQYAALLKHSGKSIALLASLCRSQSGQFPEACGARSKRQTWSCEM
jgi:hypothetical protein